MEEESFNASGREAYTWLRTARLRRRAADVLLKELRRSLAAFERNEGDDEDVFLMEDYLLSCGLAIENLAKGILIGREPNTVSDGRLVTKYWKGGEHAHDSVHLVQSILGTVTPGEADFLRRASEAVLWGGRYPIPMSSHRLGLTSQVGARKRTRRAYTTDDPGIFRSLFERLAGILTHEREERGE